MLENNYSIYVIKLGQIQIIMLVVSKLLFFIHELLVPTSLRNTYIS
jgi:hypothetical protein